MQGTPEHPKAPLGNNFRPPQPLLHRPVRTNIDFRAKQNGKLCPTMYRDLHYKGSFGESIFPTGKGFFLLFLIYPNHKECRHIFKYSLSPLQIQLDSEGE